MDLSSPLTPPLLLRGCKGLRGSVSQRRPRAATTASGNGSLKICWSTRASGDRTPLIITIQSGEQRRKAGGQHALVRCHPLLSRTHGVFKKHVKSSFLFSKVTWKTPCWAALLPILVRAGRDRGGGCGWHLTWPASLHEARALPFLQGSSGLPGKGWGTAAGSPWVAPRPSQLWDWATLEETVLHPLSIHETRAMRTGTGARPQADRRPAQVGTHQASKALPYAEFLLNTWWEMKHLLFHLILLFFKKNSGYDELNRFHIPLMGCNLHF